MSETRIMVINPNSNPVVTAGIEAAVAPDRLPGTLAIDCETLHDAPFGIESDADIAAVVPLIVERVAAASADYDAFVIACYSDPGLEECRRATRRPVLGIQESAIALSTSCERRFGVLALSGESIARHIAYVRRIGLQGFHAGERPLGISVEESVSDPATLDKIIAGGRQLIDEEGAETLILGCAGMVRHRHAAEEALGVAVIDPVQAAVTLARHGA